MGVLDTALLEPCQVHHFASDLRVAIGLSFCPHLACDTVVHHKCMLAVMLVVMCKGV